MNLEVSVDLSGIARSLNRPGGAGERLVREAADRVADRARQLAPGTMGRFIVTRTDTGSRNPAAFVISQHPASVFVVNGTRSHVIRPRRRRALRFEVGGRTVFAKVVHHPGTRANNFLMEAAREVL